jgi:hypothetical protein
MSKIVTHEVSLVKRAANKKTFAVAKSETLGTQSKTKSEEIMNDQMIEAVASTAADGEAAFIASLKTRGITDAKKLAAMVANFRVMKNFSDLVTSEEMEEVQKAAGYKKAAAKLAEMGDEMKNLARMIGDTEEPSDVPNADVDEEDILKTKKSEQLDVTAIVKAVRAEIAAEFKEREAAFVKKNESLETLVKQALAVKEDHKFVAKAEKDLRYLPASTDEIVSTLKSAYAVSDENGKAIETILGRANDALAQSPTFKTFGSTGHRGRGGNDALVKVDELAAQLVQKSGDAKLTKEQARAAIWKSEAGAKFYDEYLEDHPAQRARLPHER